ncbi:G2 mitotic-specific cyclin-B3 [Brachionus plicatilis]|uniref:G2 mitotic-specific cyclin-B3 n=1 Tax=Brachionus plicatilis TaxID=10195 RepID=A0A3M7P150_BRAPC|nr:G2 mitotic-specific cyclin-B3 [Brachionus plicatilis]
MSKLKKSNLATFTTTAFSNQAVVSINHHHQQQQTSSASCQSTTTDKAGCFQAPPQIQKKKRAALENISNSSAGLTTLSTAASHHAHKPAANPKSDQSSSNKKSRFGASVFGSQKAAKPTTTTTAAAPSNNCVRKAGVKKSREQEEELRSDVACIEQATNELDLQKEEQPEQVTGWTDIDAGDDNDEFTAADYVKQIFKYYRERESQFVVTKFLNDQPHLNKHMRSLLVDWMVEVQQQLEFNHEVLYLSVKLLDLYLSNRTILKEKLQLLGGAAMFIACKFEERMPPIIDDFIFVSDNAYDRKELIKMEIEILKTVKFDIGVPLSYTFLRRYSKCIRADMKFLTLARYILELCLQDYQFAYVHESDKACASLYLAMKMAVQFESDNAKQEIVSSQNLTATDWNETLVYFTGAFLKQFVHLVPAMNQLVKMAPQSKYNTIFKKYSHQVFHEVAKVSCLTDAQLHHLIKDCQLNSIGSQSSQ